MTPPKLFGLDMRVDPPDDQRFAIHVGLLDCIISESYGKWSFAVISANLECGETKTPLRSAKQIEKRLRELRDALNELIGDT